MSKHQEFLMLPVCGDSSDQGLTIIFEDNGVFTYNILIDKTNSLEVTSVQDQPTKVVLDLQPGIHTVEWLLADTVIHVMEVLHQPNPSKLVFVSCDLKEARPRKKPWTSIAQHEPQSIVHLGDNVYCDPEFNSDKTGSELQELYQERYRSTWKSWIKKLGGIPHYFGIDDHEITNNIHDMDQSDPRIVTAMEVYDMYQTSLTGDRVIKPDNGRYWSKSWSLDDTKVQMIYSDRPRGTSYAYREAALDLIQDDTQMLILAMAVPPFIPPYEGFIIPTLDEGEYDLDSVVTLITKVEEWLSGSSDRRVVIIGGDSHFGAIGKINNIDVAVSSPITNQPLASELKCASVLLKDGLKIGDNYTASFTETLGERNYLSLEIVDGEFVLQLVPAGLLPSICGIPGIVKFAISS